MKAKYLQYKGGGKYKDNNVCETCGCINQFLFKIGQVSYALQFQNLGRYSGCCGK